MDETDEEGKWSDDVMDSVVNMNADNFAALTIQHREVDRHEERSDIFPRVQAGKRKGRRPTKTRRTPRAERARTTRAKANATNSALWAIRSSGLEEVAKVE